MNTLQAALAESEFSVQERYEISKVAPALEEYLACHEDLRRQGMSLRSYVKTWQRDEGKPVVEPEALTSALERIQSSIGEAADLSRPQSFMT